MGKNPTAPLDPAPPLSQTILPPHRSSWKRVLCSRLPLPHLPSATATWRLLSNPPCTALALNPVPLSASLGFRNAAALSCLCDLLGVFAHSGLPRALTLTLVGSLWVSLLLPSFHLLPGLKLSCVDVTIASPSPFWPWLLCLELRNHISSCLQATFTQISHKQLKGKHPQWNSTTHPQLRPPLVFPVLPNSFR